MNNTVPPGYKQTEVGVIPEEWEVDSVGKAFEICNHLRLPISQAVRERMNGPYPYYGPTNIQGYINEYRVDGEYALIGEDGDHFLKWREQSMTLLVKGQFNVNNHAHIIRGTKNLTEWFFWYFAHNDITPHLSRQGAGRFKLNKKTLVQIPCVIPPLPEQRAIATALSDVDTLIASLDKLIAKKRDMKQAAMQELLTGKRLLPGFSGEWEVKRVVDIARVGRGRVISHREIGLSRTPQYPVYSSQTSNDGIMGYLDTYDFEGDYVTWTTDGVNAGKVFSRNGRFNCTNVCGTLLIAGDDPRYVALALDRVSRGYVSTNLANPKLMNGVMKQIEIAMPPTKPEQTAISAILSDMDTEIASLEQKRDKTRLLKQGMMQELLTGRIRLV